MKKMARFLKAFRKQVILGPIFKLIEAIFELIVPLVMANVIDVGVKTGDIGYVLKMGGVMLLLGAVGLASSLTCQRFAAQASQGYGTTVRNALFRHIGTLSHAEIDRLGTARLITRLTSDVNQLQFAVAMLIRLVVRAPFLVIGAIVMAMLIDLKLSLIFLIVSPVLAFLIWFIMSRTIPYYQKVQKKVDDISNIAGEQLEGARVIRAFGKQVEETERGRQASEDLARTNILVGRISMLLNPLTAVVLNLGIAAIIWFGGIQVDTGTLTQGQIVAFVNYMNQILLALIVVANLVIIFTKAAASASRVNEVFETVSSIREEQSSPVAPVAGAPRIAFQNVTFQYDGEPVLENLNFTIHPGETVGIIGGTGAGKSTLVNLIPRFYDTTKGSVLVDGIDVRQYPISQLRQKISIVPQKASLLRGTIEQNLRFKKPDASEKELQRALSIAQCDEFISRLPDGIETNVSEGAKNLSGGQKQRLTIARALVGGCDILIMDDSLSALDYATDAALRRAFRQEMQGVTLLIISQRASALRHADKILVLDNGRICGMGSHAQLMESCSVYKEIVQSQEQNSEEEVSA